MQKITEIYEYRNLTREERDQFGRIQMVKKDIRCKREVDSASAGKRILNLLIDYGCLSVFSCLLYFNPSTKSYMGIIILIYPLYFILTEYYFQQTLGKKITKTKVVDVYGKRPSLKQIVLRTLIRALSYDGITFLVRDRGWHDTWTKTYVLSIEEIEEIEELLQDEENLKP